MSLKNFINTALPKVEATVKNIIKKSIDPTIADLSRIFHNHLGLEEPDQARGKRIRPLLVLLTANATGTDWKKALPVAAAVELLHNFSLIHDDIEDHSTLRRGRPTVWASWGTAQAINAGDGMFALVFEAVSGLLEESRSKEVSLDALKILTKTCIRLVEGQFQEHPADQLFAYAI